MVYLCAGCHSLLRITAGTTKVIASMFCTICGYDYFHEDYDNAEEVFDHLWIDLGGES